MRIFVAGATGVVGRSLVPQLVARGHEVVGMTRSASKQALVRSLGARPVVADALDGDAVVRAVAFAEPEVIVHQLTASSGPMSLREARRPERSFAATMTNRLRTEATDHLLAAGRSVAARRTSTSKTRRRPRWRSSAAGRVSTTSSTTSPPPCGDGCRSSPARWKHGATAYIRRSLGRLLAECELEAGVAQGLD